MGYWLLKSDATAFGFTDLETAPAQTTPWEGVRNYQARNLLRDSLRLGDQAFSITPARRTRPSPASSKSCGRAIPMKPPSILKVRITIPPVRASSRAGIEWTCGSFGVCAGPSRWPS